MKAATLAGRRNLRRYNGDDTIRTPSVLYLDLDAEFHFTLDAAADEANHLAPAWFDGKAHGDGLLERWAPHVVFCNPPYSDIAPWVAKARAESLRGATVVMVLPARTDLDWFQDYALEGEVRFIRGRMRFEFPPTSPLFGKRGTAPHASIVVVFRPGDAR